MMKLLAFLVLTFVSAVAQAQVNVKVSWTHDGVSCTDGTKDCPLLGFEMKEGGNASSMQYKQTLQAPVRDVTYVIPAGGQRCYQVTAIGGTQSVPIYSESSPIICRSAPSAPPSGPKQPMAPVVTVTITVSPSSP